MENKKFFDQSAMNTITKIFDDTIKTEHKIITEETTKSTISF